MLKIFFIVLLAVSIYAGAADAHGGAEPMPQIGYTDLPSYHPNPSARHIKPMNCCRRHPNTAHSD